MIFKEALPTYSYELLKRVSKNTGFSKFYLAGGTSLALQIGHRKSVDLDFFSSEPFSSNITSELKDDYKAISISNNSIELIVENTKVMFWYFAFPLIKELVKKEKLSLADPLDIGLMKLLAIQGRTTKKDIIDLYFIDKEIIKLEDLLELFESSYKETSFNAYSSLKSLFDIEKLKNDPMPEMLKEVSFDEAFELVTDKIGRHLKQKFKM